MFDKLEKHHLGFIVPLEEKEHIEKRVGKKFIYDALQQTHVLFVYDEVLHIYIEYICREGRVARQKPGFAHICYNLKGHSDLEKVKEFISEKKVGYKLTDLEKSVSKECGYVSFYFIKDMGVVELNVQEKERE